MKSFDGFESKDQKDFESFMMQFKPEFRDFKKVGDFTYSNTLTSIAYDSYLAGQQSKQAKIDKLQKRIDLAIERINIFYMTNGMSDLTHDEIYGILKGTTNEQ